MKNKGNCAGNFLYFSVFSVQFSVGGSVCRTAFLMRCFATPQLIPHSELRIPH